MNTRRRREALLKLLMEQKRVSINDIARRFDVTTMTVRRDLKRFAQDGIVTLMHGGAVYNEGGYALPAVTAREHAMQAEKNALGRYCAGLVKTGNAIYLDGGSTVLKIAEALLPVETIAVLTHPQPVINILAHAHNIQLIPMTGTYEPSSKAFYGEMTVEMISRFRIDIAFLGTGAIDERLGLMSSVIADQAVKQALLRSARRKVVVVDHTKIRHELFLRVADLRELDDIVTDRQADADFVQAARRQGVHVVQV